MSIISSDAKWAVLQRVVRLSLEEIRGTTKGKEYEAGFIAGATRRPTNEEIVAGAKAFYEALKPDSYPQWDSDCALRAEYYDAMSLKRLKRKCEKYANRERKAIAYVATLKEES